MFCHTNVNRQTQTEAAQGFCPCHFWSRHTELYSESVEDESPLVLELSDFCAPSSCCNRFLQMRHMTSKEFSSTSTKS